MRTARMRRTQARAPIQSRKAIEEQRLKQKAEEERQKKMELEKEESDDSEKIDEDDMSSDDEVPMKKAKSDREIINEMTMEEAKQHLAPKSVNKLRINEELYGAIKDRYQQLLKELCESSYSLEDFNFSQEEKDILNERVRLWLEYFVSTATFRDENVNLFDYMDTFTKTQKFI